MRRANASWCLEGRQSAPNVKGDFLMNFTPAIYQNSCSYLAIIFCGPAKFMIVSDISFHWLHADRHVSCIVLAPGKRSLTRSSQTASRGGVPAHAFYSTRRSVYLELEDIH